MISGAYRCILAEPQTGIPLLATSLMVSNLLKGNNSFEAAANLSSDGKPTQCLMRRNCSSSAMATISAARRRGYRRSRR